MAFGAGVLALIALSASLVYLLSRPDVPRFTVLGEAAHGRSVSLTVENREKARRRYTVETRVLGRTFRTNQFTLGRRRTKTIVVRRLPPRRTVIVELSTPGHLVPFRVIHFQVEATRP